IANKMGLAYYTLDDIRDTGRVMAQVPRTQCSTMLDFACLRGATLEEDLRLRDFTINALAMTLDGQIVDPTNGQQDLREHKIRQTSEQSFPNDPVRLLRAIRQAGQLKFEIETETEKALRHYAKRITEPAPERIREELMKILHLSDSAGTLEKTEDYGILSQIIPEVTELKTISQSWPHHYDNVWEHTMAAVTALEIIGIMLKGHTPAPHKFRYVPVPNWAWGILESTLTPMQAPLFEYLNYELNPDVTREDLLKWGALFHDIGKATTRTVDEKGLTHFKGHDKEGAIKTGERLSALRFSNKAITFVTTLVSNHMRLISLEKGPLTKRAIYRFYRDTEEVGTGIILLALADTLAVWGRNLRVNRWENLLKIAEVLLNHYFYQHEQTIAPPPLLTGYDLLDIGIPQGPEMGRLLEKLQEAQAIGEVDSYEKAIAFIKDQSSTKPLLPE
ncbi:MAG: HD domain-containing protein, partial [Anaerolineae bacterium]|nr:HD domain-containing protein [Anaerolineae bacterium]